MIEATQVTLPSNKKIQICQAKKRHTLLNLKGKANILLGWGLNKTLRLLICATDEEVEQEYVSLYREWKVTVQTRSSA